MYMIFSFGKPISTLYGRRTFWILYLLGAFSGSLAMHFGMPYVPNVIPQVGANAPIFAMATFYTLMNLNQVGLRFFFVPVPPWVSFL